MMESDLDAVSNTILRARDAGVLSTARFGRQPSRAPDYALENAALSALANALAGPEDTLLEALAATAMRLCQAAGAGISQVEPAHPGPRMVRWIAGAGLCAPHVGLTMPLRHSPCAIALGLTGPQLLSLPQRHFPGLPRATPAIAQELIVAIANPKAGRADGALWVMSQDGAAGFDAEDARLLTSLANFTGAALNLRHAREVLEQSEARKDEFIAMLGHELRNPMAPIDSAIAVARRRSEGNQPVLDVLGTAQRQMRHLRRLVDDLLDASRIKQGKLSISLEQASLNEIVYDAVSAVKHHVDSRGHTLTLSGLDQPIAVHADHVRLSQMLGNLLSNAAKYTPPGGAIAIDIACAQAPGRVDITVRDNGIGIDAKLLPHVFELFTQHASDSARSQGGLGIGLSIVKRMVELHEGSIEIASQGAGQGTVVTLHLPILSRLEHAVARPALEPPGSTRILLVDDNADALQALGMLLELEGHQVEMADGGEAALRLTEHYVPQVALIDIGMPGIDGFQLVHMLRARPQLDATKLVALTGYASESERSRALAAGFDFHLTKPLSLDKLFDVLHQLADDRRGTPA
jgi:signal transduction histidine kinase/ActR/RegA family two-component response regulator